jgi:hypothetical protein
VQALCSARLAGTTSRWDPCLSSWVVSSALVCAYAHARMKETAVRLNTRARVPNPEMDWIRDRTPRSLDARLTVRARPCASGPASQLWHGGTTSVSQNYANGSPGWGLNL